MGALRDQFGGKVGVMVGITLGSGDAVSEEPLHAPSKNTQHMHIITVDTFLMSYPFKHIQSIYIKSHFYHLLISLFSVDNLWKTNLLRQ
jgi:hypothetical protein